MRDCTKCFIIIAVIVVRISYGFQSCNNGGLSSLFSRVNWNNDNNNNRIRNNNNNINVMRMRKENLSRAFRDKLLPSSSSSSLKVKYSHTAVAIGSISRSRSSKLYVGANNDSFVNNFEDDSNSYAENGTIKNVSPYEKDNINVKNVDTGVHFDDDTHKHNATRKEAVSSCNSTLENSSRLRMEAEKLRRMAKELTNDAMKMETELERVKKKRKKQINADSDSMIGHIFERISGLTIDVTNVNSDSDSNSNITFQEERIIQDVKKIFRNERWSPQQIMMVLERLHERQLTAKLDIPTSSMIPSSSEGEKMTRRKNKRSLSPRAGDDTQNMTAGISNETEWHRYESKIRLIIEAASDLDDEYNISNKKSTKYINDRNYKKNKIITNTRWTGRVGSMLKSRRKELFHKRVLEKRRQQQQQEVPVNTKFDHVNEDVGILEAKDQQNKNTNGTKPSKEDLVRVPLWVPSTLLPYMLSSQEKVEKNDIEVIKNEILLGSRFYCTSYESIPHAVIFRGNVRPSPETIILSSSESSTNSKNNAAQDRARNNNYTAAVFDNIQYRLQNHKNGLSDRVQLFFLEDPEWRAGNDILIPKPNPVILALPGSLKPTMNGIENITSSPMVKQVLVSLTLSTTFCFAVSCYALNEKFFHFFIYQKKMSSLITCIPLFLGVIIIQIFHEIAHHMMAKRKDIILGKPTPLPSTQLGTFGCITPLKSFPKNREALFDTALIGPGSTIILSIIMMIVGTFRTINASTELLLNFPAIPVGIFRSSFLSSWILMAIAPKVMMMPISQPIPVHPMVVAGFSGLISSSLNLLPIFRLDGGRVVGALFGQRAVGFTSAYTLLLMFSSMLSGSSKSGIAFLWGLLIIVFQRRSEVPPRNDVTGVNERRLSLWVISLATAILALVPFPGGQGFL